MYCVLFTIGFIAGGAASAVNAVNVQLDYYDAIGCEDIQDNNYYYIYNPSSDHSFVEICDDIEKLIRAQSNAAVSTFIYYCINECIAGIKFGKVIGGFRKL